MFFFDKHLRAAAGMTLASLILAGILSAVAPAQQSAPASGAESVYAAAPHGEPSSIAMPLAEDRGAAALEQSLKRLSTTASVMMIVAHPDDEDGALLTYLSRGMGVRCT